MSTSYNIAGMPVPIWSNLPNAKRKRLDSLGPNRLTEFTGIGYPGITGYCVERDSGNLWFVSDTFYLYTRDELAAAFSVSTDELPGLLQKPILEIHCGLDRLQFALSNDPVEFSITYAESGSFDMKGASSHALDIGMALMDFESRNKEKTVISCDQKE
jgi:hypothetical protein